MFQSWCRRHQAAKTLFLFSRERQQKSRPCVGCPLSLCSKQLEFQYCYQKLPTQKSKEDRKHNWNVSTKKVLYPIHTWPTLRKEVGQDVLPLLFSERTSEGWIQTLRQAYYPEGSAMCVQGFDDSRNSAIHITYRISLRPSSLRLPRHPWFAIVLGFWYFSMVMLASFAKILQCQRAIDIKDCVGFIK